MNHDGGSLPTLPVNLVATWQRAGSWKASLSKLKA